MDVPVWPCGVHVLLAAVGAAVFSLLVLPFFGKILHGDNA